MKDIYEALNDVDMDLSEYEDKPLNDIEVKKINDRIRGKLKHKMVKKLKWIKRVAIIIGTLTLALGVTYKANPTFATNLPVVGNLLKNIIGNGEKILSTGGSASHNSKGTVGENRFNTPKKGIKKLNFKLEIGNIEKNKNI